VVLQTASGDAASGFLMSEPIRDYLTRVADEEGIPYQLGVFSFSNTDAGSVYVSAGGIPTGPVTIPRRYSHSPVEMLDLNDAVAAFRLCLAVVRRAGDFPRGIV
jgi:endoglucanase